MYISFLRKKKVICDGVGMFLFILSFLENIEQWEKQRKKLCVAKKRDVLPLSLVSLHECCLASFQTLLLLSLFPTSSCVAAYALLSLELFFALTFRNPQYRIHVPIQFRGTQYTGGMKSATSLLQIIVYTTLHFGAWLAAIYTCSLCIITTGFDKVGCPCWQSLVSKTLIRDRVIGSLGGGGNFLTCAFWSYG